MTHLNDTFAALEAANLAYRQGAELLSDADYDALRAAAQRENPLHPFFNEPEPEPSAPGSRRVRHLAPMLSTNKAFTDADVSAFADRIREALPANYPLPAGKVVVRVTPKLDGVACYRSGELAYTRGKGGYGTDISALFERGWISGDAERPGGGEIVVSEDYFQRTLKPRFGQKHPRSFVAGFVGAETLEAYHLDAIAQRQVKWVSHSGLEGVMTTLEALVRDWRQMLTEATGRSPYRCDGAVVDVMDPALRSILGATSDHHRWQLALKINDQFANATVEAIRMSTGRTGVITPTLQLSPTEVDGVTVTWVTAHNVARLREVGAGVGATVTITRSGGVIPFLTGVPKAAPVDDALFAACPSCGGATHEDGPSLYCSNTVNCPAQAARRIEHFFSLTNCKGFGEVVCDQLASAGLVSPAQVLTLSAEQLVAAGISSGIARNLLDDAAKARREPLSEAYFLAGLAVKNLGRGDSRKLLEVVTLADLETITAGTVAGIHGFGDKTSGQIAADLRALWPEIKALLALGWNLESVRVKAPAGGSAIAGKTLVFTGAMAQSRDDMEAHARSLGAQIGSGVNKKTDFLVCGDKVGAAKTGKATELGVRVISEAEYRSLIGQ